LWRKFPKLEGRGGQAWGKPDRGPYITTYSRKERKIVRNKGKYNAERQNNGVPSKIPDHSSGDVPGKKPGVVRGMEVQAPHVRG